MEVICNENIQPWVDPMVSAGTHYFEPAVWDYNSNLRIANKVIYQSCHFMAVAREKFKNGWKPEFTAERK